MRQLHAIFVFSQYRQGRQIAGHLWRIDCFIMRLRSSAFVPALFVALTAAFVLGLSFGAAQPRAAAG
ncbi:MAG TPA: hypothetical protein VKH42_02675, partial [Vicinamibacterales bacterium]|nr:hypothetical protein [Vicinamibacterales bacterium]